jgi:fructose-specific phosphotransferase system IIA component
VKRNLKRIAALFCLIFLVGTSLFAEETGSMTEVMASLVLQIGFIIFAVRIGGWAVKKLGIPSVLGELLAGVVIGPFALGGIPLPGFPSGIFPVASSALAVSPELYSFATIASIILLFASGLETDLGLFLKYSVVGGIVGLGGVIVSFAFGDLTGVFLLKTGFMDPRCLFLGILCTATSVGITARILSDQKKMDSPEGVTILAAAVFDDVLGIVFLAIVLGIVALQTGTGSGGNIDLGMIGAIAGKSFGIWLGFTAAGLIFSKKIAGFLKLFKGSYGFSISALGIALVLAGLFEKQGLAMIIGAYVTGLSLSKTDIAAVIQERIHGLYEFFVPLFFAVMGMLVNVGELLSFDVLAFGLIYTVIAILAKIIGCGIPTLALGFNAKGAARIGIGMIPRGEVALIIAGIGMTAGILDERLFGVTIMMTLITTLVAPPLLNFTLKIPGRGTRIETKASQTESIAWDFHSDEIAGLVVDTLLKDLKSDGFYVQMMNIESGITQARKDDTAISITETGNILTIETAPEDIQFVRTTIYEVVVKLHHAIQELKETTDPQSFKKDTTVGSCRKDDHFKKLIKPECITVSLKGSTKEEVIRELVELVEKTGTITDSAQVIADILIREKAMSTGMQHGIAIPHCRTEAISEMKIAIGVHQTGVDFKSIDGKPSKIFILLISPKNSTGPHLRTLASIGKLMTDTTVTERVLNAQTPVDIERILLEVIC